MTNYLDFLLILDAHTRDSSLGYVQRGYDMYGISTEAGLTSWGDHVVARWTGELVHHGYLDHGPASLGDRHPSIPGPSWNENELQRYDSYRVTPAGREEADRLRRHLREGATDTALGLRFPSLSRPWMTEVQQRAVLEPLTRLQAALDGDYHSAAIGAAKELVEAACKLNIERSGQEAPAAASLPTLFKQASHAQDAEAEESESPLGRSLASVVQRLAELRNAVGAGHGHASPPQVSARDARLAASTGTAIAAFLLSNT